MRSAAVLRIQLMSPRFHKYAKPTIKTPKNTRISKKATTAQLR